MIARDAAWVARVTGGQLQADAGVEVSSVHNDSRECVPGSLYVAFPGERADGHDFVEKAAAAGATLHLVTRAVDAPHVLVKDATEALGALARAYLAELREASEIRVIGITGSNGKTTTKDLLGAILPDAIAPAGSFNNEIGLPLTVLRADGATRHLVLEMGAAGVGQIAYLADIAPLDIAVVLGVGQAHLGMYADIDEVAAAKSEIVAGLRADGVVVLNADDPRVAAMGAKAPRVVTFGCGEADVRATDVQNVAGRARITVVDGPIGFLAAQCVPETATLTLVGEHHVTNALAAIAVARECGIPLATALRQVAAAGPASPHRMHVTARPDGVTVVDDSYNASPESMRAALRALKDVAQGGRTIAVVGEMLELGDASREAHAAVGVDAVRFDVSHLVVVGAGAKPAFDAAVREGSWGDEAAYVASIEDALPLLNQLLREGDTVLIKGSHGSGLWKLADELAGKA